MIAYRDAFFRKQNTYRRNYNISDALYHQLSYLSENVYDASVNRMVCLALRNLIESNELALFDDDEILRSKDYSKRSFMFPEELIDGLDALGEKHRISNAKIIDIAIYNALKAEADHLRKMPK